MNAVTHTSSDAPVVDDVVLRDLHAAAKSAPLRRARLCLHRDADDAVQEMVIALCRDTVVRAHRHPGRSESIHVIDGALRVVLYDGDGRASRRVALGEGGARLLRISCGQWHSVEVLSDMAFVHEVVQGPFDGRSSEFAPWVGVEEGGPTAAPLNGVFGDG